MTETIETASAELIELARGWAETAREDHLFKWVVTREEVPTCGVWLNDGDDIECLAVAEDILGNFSVMRMDGSCAQFLHGEVA